MFKERRRRVVEQASRENCSHVIASTPQNIFYVTGFWGGGYAVLTNEGTTFVTGTLEGERARAHIADADVITVQRGRGMTDAVLPLLDGAQRVCVDDAPASLFNALSKKIQKGLTCAPQVFSLPRRVKDTHELTSLVEGGKIVDKLYEHAEEVVKPGANERKVEGELILRAYELGCDIPGFAETLNPFIVASGPNSAFPHATLTNRKIHRGDFVTLDIVIRYKGYIVDTTRTFAVDSASREMKKVYDIVLDAQVAGFEKARTGVSAREVDKASRRVIEEEGYGAFFVHSTGHGVGIDVHEMPRVSQDSEDILLKGEAITVEPGIYLKEKFGVRIEDSLIVDDPPRILTSYPREIIVVG